MTSWIEMPYFTQVCVSVYMFVHVFACHFEEMCTFLCAFWLCESILNSP